MGSINISRRTEDPSCECRRERETVAHCLLVCERYEEQTDVLRRRTEDGMKVESLLEINEIDFTNNIH